MKCRQFYIESENKLKAEGEAKVLGDTTLCRIELRIIPKCFIHCVFFGSNVCFYNTSNQVRASWNLKQGTTKLEFAWMLTSKTALTIFQEIEQSLRR